MKLAAMMRSKISAREVPDTLATTVLVGSICSRGGVGMRRGRRDGLQLLPGDVVDCSRVESIEPPRHLRLTAEMKVPGRAWLEFDLLPTAGGVILRQTATFDPVGLWGLTYWYAFYPLHLAGTMQSKGNWPHAKGAKAAKESRKLRPKATH